MKLKTKIAEAKAKLKKHAPELLVFTTSVAGSVGWILAGYYCSKLNELRDTPPNLLIMHHEVHDDGTSRSYWFDEAGFHQVEETPENSEQ